MRERPRSHAPQRRVAIKAMADDQLLPSGLWLNQLAGSGSGSSDLEEQVLSNETDTGWLRCAATVNQHVDVL